MGEGQKNSVNLSLGSVMNCRMVAAPAIELEFGEALTSSWYQFPQTLAATLSATSS